MKTFLYMLSTVLFCNAMDDSSGMSLENIITLVTQRVSENILAEVSNHVDLAMWDKKHLSPADRKYISAHVRLIVANKITYKALVDITPEIKEPDIFEEKHLVLEELNPLTGDQE